MVHQEEGSPIFSLSPPRCIFSFLPPFPRELRSFPIARGWCRGKEKKVFLIFRSGETFRSSPKEEEERRIANIQSLLFVREKLCRQGERTLSVLCTVGFSYCAKKQGIRMWYTNVRMWAGLTLPAGAIARERRGNEEIRNGVTKARHTHHRLTDEKSRNSFFPGNVLFLFARMRDCDRSSILPFMLIAPFPLASIPGEKCTTKSVRLVFLRGPSCSSPLSEAPSFPPFLSTYASMENDAGWLCTIVHSTSSLSLSPFFFLPSALFPRVSELMAQGEGKGKCLSSFSRATCAPHTADR